MRYVFVRAIVYVARESKPRAKSRLWPVMSTSFGVDRRLVAPDSGAGTCRISGVMQVKVEACSSPAFDRSRQMSGHEVQACRPVDRSRHRPRRRNHEPSSRGRYPAGFPMPNQAPLRTPTATCGRTFQCVVGARPGVRICGAFRPVGQPRFRSERLFSCTHRHGGASASRLPGRSNHTVGQAETQRPCTRQRQRARGRHAARSAADGARLEPTRWGTAPHRREPVRPLPGPPGSAPTPDEAIASTRQRSIRRPAGSIFRGAGIVRERDQTRSYDCLPRQGRLRPGTFINVI